MKESRVRLNKFISHNSKYSRREADNLIQTQQVKIDGKVVNDLATQVDENSVKVTIGKSTIKKEDKPFTVIVYNKQRAEIVSKKDPQGRKTVFNTLAKKFENFIPIGRLDYLSEGVLLLTDSVKVYNKLVHSNLERTYKLKLKGNISPKMIVAMEEGLELDDASKGAHEKSDIKEMVFAPFIAYQVLSETNNFTKIKVVINEGKNRELRRFFSHFDMEVLDLKRVDFGGISLNNLPSGKTRYLSRQEYRGLRKFLYDDAPDINTNP